jgi:hypothetical protein
LADVSGTLGLVGSLLDSGNKSFLNAFFREKDAFEQLHIGLNQLLDSIQNQSFGASTPLVELENFVQYWNELNMPWIYLNEESIDISSVLCPFIECIDWKFEVIRLVQNGPLQIKTESKVHKIIIPLFSLEFI